MKIAVKKGWRVLLATLLSLGAGGGVRAQETPAIHPARLDYKINTLSNGLKIITLEDHRAPHEHYFRSPSPRST